VSNSNPGQLRIWGRANSVNVQKVLWCLRELDLAHERIDAGMAFGRNRETGVGSATRNARILSINSLRSPKGRLALRHKG